MCFGMIQKSVQNQEEDKRRSVLFHEDVGGEKGGLEMAVLKKEHLSCALKDE